MTSKSLDVRKYFFKKKSDVVDSSETFEEKNHRLQEKINFIYKTSGTCGVVFGLLSLTALIMALPLKQTQTEVFTVDNNTGVTEKITAVKKEQISENQAIARYFVTQYVKFREGYNYFRLQQDYDAIMLWSAEGVANDYNLLFKSDKAPKIIYNKAERTASVEILSVIITPSSNKDDPDTLANVRFRKTIKDVSTGLSKDEFWNVRLTFRLNPENEMSTTERNQNPLGFVVTSYAADKEVRG
ncbi:type IV secretion system protein [Escherichia albertii]|nr:type IV secretion system protein [Escherichia albertii]